MILGSKNSDQGSDGDVGDKAPSIVDGPAMGITGSAGSSSSGTSSSPGGDKAVGLGRVGGESCLFL
jgi:hypothetical protein